MRRITETDPGEVVASKQIVRLLEYVDSLTDVLEPYKPPLEGSSLAQDTDLLPQMEVGATAHQLLVSAQGSLQALSRSMNVTKSKERYSIDGYPHGVYDLIRNSLETAATALWLTTPTHSRQRGKRVLLILRQENHDRFTFLKAAGLATDEEIKYAEAADLRLDGYAASLGLTGWKKADGRHDTKKYPQPRSSKILETVNAYNPVPGATSLSWEAAWRACSGFAHGKGWPMVLLHQYSPFDADEAGVQTLVTISYQVAAAMLMASCNLLTTATRHYELCRTGIHSRRVAPAMVPVKWLVESIAESNAPDTER